MLMKAKMSMRLAEQRRGGGLVIQKKQLSPYLATEEVYFGIPVPTLG